MELSIRPYGKNKDPLQGVLVKDQSPRQWMQALHQLRLAIEEVSIYPLPGLKSNTIWGCVIVCRKDVDPHLAGRYELCQRAANNLLIPEKSILHPAVTAEELENLFRSTLHIIHPEFGMAELTSPLHLASFISEPVMRSFHITRPEPPVFIPNQVQSFRIKPLKREEVLENIEKKLFPKKEEMRNDSLTLAERIKYFLMKLFLTRRENTDVDSKVTRSIAWTSAFSFLRLFWKKVSYFEERAVSNFEELGRRNKSQVDKLLDLLKKNPDEGLKYAIPLNDYGTTRGGESLSFTLFRRWLNFSLFEGSNNGGTSGTVSLGDAATALRLQYQATAQELLNAGEYHKAAFVYLKLLKSDMLAAQALEQGGYYQEAAHIYLKNLSNVQKAAECYEKGRMIDEAIALYQQLQQDEKVGDLYALVGKKKEADLYYEKVVHQFKNKGQYLKGSLVYTNKMGRPDLAQALLFSGWKENKDAQNCLNTYLSLYTDEQAFKNETYALYMKLGTDSRRNQMFLEALRHQYKRRGESMDWIREMAYEIVASQAHQNPNIVIELKYFNDNDKQFLKDTFRFRLGKKL